MVDAEKTVIYFILHQSPQRTLQNSHKVQVNQNNLGNQGGGFNL